MRVRSGRPGRSRSEIMRRPDRKRSKGSVGYGPAIRRDYSDERGVFKSAKLWTAPISSPPLGNLLPFSSGWFSPFLKADGYSLWLDGSVPVREQNDRSDTSARQVRHPTGWQAADHCGLAAARHQTLGYPPQG